MSGQGDIHAAYRDAGQSEHGFWQANARSNPPAIIRESRASPDKRMILFCMCFENQSGSVAQILTEAGTKLMQISSR